MLREFFRKLLEVTLHRNIMQSFSYPRNQMPAYKQPNNSAEIRSTPAWRSQRPCGVDTALSSRLISSSKLVNIAVLISSSCKLYVACRPGWLGTSLVDIWHPIVYECALGDAALKVGVLP
jgi:hypothetical protein